MKIYTTDIEIRTLAEELAENMSYTVDTIYKLLISYRDFLGTGFTKKQAERQVSAKAYFGY